MSRPLQLVEADRVLSIVDEALHYECTPSVAARRILDRLRCSLERMDRHHRYYDPSYVETMSYGRSPLRDAIERQISAVSISPLLLENIKMPTKENEAPKDPALALITLQLAQAEAKVAARKEDLRRAEEGLKACKTSLELVEVEAASFKRALKKIS
jgi:hypothetical protein